MENKMKVVMKALTVTIHMMKMKLLSFCDANTYVDNADSTNTYGSS
jgi:hypothetical protein